MLVGREKIAQAIERLNQSRAAFLPQISVTASQVRETKNLEAQGMNIPGVPPLIGPYNSFDARVRLMQNIFDARTVATYQALQVGRDMALAEQKKAQHEAVAIAGALYIQTLRSWERVELAKALLAKDREALRLAQSAWSAGSAARVSTLESRAQIEAGQSRLEIFQKEAGQATIDLAAALGLNPDTQLKLKAIKDDIPTPLPSDEEVIEEVKEHPEVAWAKKSLRQSELNRKIQVADFLPKIQGGADYGASGNTPANAKTTYMFGAQAQWPLFEGGLRIGKVREASGETRQKKIQLKETEKKVEAGIRAAGHSVKAAVTEVRAAHADYAKALQKLAIAKERFDSGLGTHYELTEALAALALARDNLREAKAVQQLARLELIYRSGKIDQYLQTLLAKQGLP